MSNQVSRSRNDVLPIRLDEQIRRDEEESRKEIKDEVQRIVRGGSYSWSNGPDYDIVYNITENDIQFEDILEELEGITSRVLEREFSKDGEKSKSYVRDDDNDLKRYMEWFFQPQEVFDVREIDILIDDTPVWNDIFYVGGYSGIEEDKQEFGPFDSFEGPPLKYALVFVNNEEQESFFDYSGIESSTYHPQVKLDQYTEDGTYPQEVLKQGPETSF